MALKLDLAGTHDHFCPLCGDRWQHAVASDDVCGIIADTGEILDKDELYCYDCERWYENH